LNNKNIFVGQVAVHFGKNVAIIKENNILIKAKLRTNIPKLAVGDMVYYEQSASDLVVTGLVSRTTLLKRADKLVAANVDQMLIVIAPIPAVQSQLIDSYLVAANLTGIKPIIVLNKIDLLEKENANELYDLLQIYQKLKYEIIEISCHSTYNIAKLHQYLNAHVSVIVGQSGVGKTSLVNQLLPNQFSKTRELSNIMQGKHTTSFAQLFVLPSGGKLIDSPGVRSFTLDFASAAQITEGFIEISMLAKKCKFTNCSHQTEPDCAVQNALQQNLISLERFKNYQYLLANIN